HAVRTKIQGAWIVGVGAMLFIFNGVLLEQLYQFLDLEMPQTLRTYMRFSLYLTMPITITLYLAVRSANLTRMLARQRDDLDVEVMDRTADLNFEKERSETLLRNILPDAVVQELKDKGSALAREYAGATILFSDFKEFTRISQTMSPQALVEELDTCFKEFDRIISAKGIEKIKTIGDAYMCVGGLPDPSSTTPADVVRAGLEMQSFISARKTSRDRLGQTAFEMRVGLHTGPVVAGIVGVKKFQYDIWGDTVNTASRMESSGEVGHVNISEATYDLVKEEPDLVFTPRGKVQVKGKGELEMYFVENAAGHVGRVAA
ncbi:MAG: adenylate/guanylate cyclase domain-containing protein, partial [Flavobacteriales bacterium]